MDFEEVGVVSGGGEPFCSLPQPLPGVMPISWSLPAGAGGSDVTLWGIGYDTGNGTIGAGVSDDHSTFGIIYRMSF